MCDNIKSKLKLDRKALLKAKYSPRVAAVSCRHKAHKKPCDLDRWFIVVVGRGTYSCRTWSS